MKELKEIAKDYKISIQMLRTRIVELREQRDKPLQDKYFDVDPDVVKDRITKLNNLLNNLREVTREVEHYYDKGWWRSGKYTFNQNKPRPVVYSEPVYDTTINKQRKKSRNESLFGSGFTIITHRKAKKSNEDVL